MAQVAAIGVLLVFSNRVCLQHGNTTTNSSGKATVTTLLSYSNTYYYANYTPEGDSSSQAVISEKTKSTFKILTWSGWNGGLAYSSLVRWYTIGY